MARARNGNAIQSKIQMTIYGEPFTGKSTMASQFAYMKNPDGSPFKVLYLDPESGSIDDYLGTMKANGVNPANIWIVYTQSLTEVLDYISRATNNEDFYEIDDDGNETDTVVLDGDGILQIITSKARDIRPDRTLYTFKLKALLLIFCLLSLCQVTVFRAT